MSFTYKKDKSRFEYLGKGILAVVVLSVIAFTGWKLYPIIHGPAVSFSNLFNGIETEESKLTISGKARYTRDLAINGEIIPLAPNGDFVSDFALAPGYNIVSISATDQYGKSNSETFTIFYKVPPTPQILTLGSTAPLSNEILEQ